MERLSIEDLETAMTDGVAHFGVMPLVIALRDAAYTAAAVAEEQKAWPQMGTCLHVAEILNDVVETVKE